MSLSVCCLAGAPGPRVRALIEPLREVADEIVIAADVHVDAASLAEYALAADRVHRLEVSYLERHLAWLHAQCSGDWIFRIDADEVASPALIDALPRLIEDRGVRQYWIPRVWVFPDTGHWLDEPPWWPDYQLRLYRKDCFLRFAGALHSTAVSQPPDDYIEPPLYHLDLLVNSLEERERKAKFYDALRPDMVAPGGGAMNERYYVPEVARSLEMGTIPKRDARELARVLDARAVADSSRAPEIAVVPLAVSDRWLEDRPFDPDVHRGEIAAVERKIHMMISEQRALHFRVTNGGTESWAWHNPDVHAGKQVRLGYHWLNADGSVHDYAGLRRWLPRRLDPGKSTVVPLMVRAPSVAGEYELEVDLVHERWFGCSVRVRVVVTSGDEDDQPTQPAPEGSLPTRSVQARRIMVERDPETRNPA